MMVAVFSIKGSPGVTTLCVALAARWPQPARTILVEADPVGGDLSTRFLTTSGPGLIRLAAATRQSVDADLLGQHAEILPNGLSAVTAPPDSACTRTALSTIATGSRGRPEVMCAASAASNTVVIADCGRLDIDSPAEPIVRAADTTLLVTTAKADGLAHVARRLPRLRNELPRLELVLVGEGYPVNEIARELAIVPLAWIPNDPRGAAVLGGEASRRRRSHVSRSPLGHSAGALGAALTHGGSKPTNRLPGVPAAAEALAPAHSPSTDQTVTAQQGARP